MAEGVGDMDSAIKRGLVFIEGLQSERSHWTEFNSPNAGQSTQWVTGYIASAISRSRRDSALRYPFLDRATGWLLSTMLPGGGWGYKTHFLPDADSTANVIRFLASYCRDLLPESMLGRLGDFLLSFLDPDTGGFVTFRALPYGMDYMSNKSVWCKPDISVSAMAGLALVAIDRERYGEVIDNLGSFLREAQSKEGYWETFWWDDRIYGTFTCCTLLSLLDEDSAVLRAADWLSSQVTASGGWGNGYEMSPLPFTTALAISTLRLVGYRDKYSGKVEVGKNWLIERQQPDGSWNSSARVREPEPQVYSPWEPSNRSKMTIVTDINRLFTTSSVIEALGAEGDSRL